MLVFEEYIFMVISSSFHSSLQIFLKSLCAQSITLESNYLQTECIALSHFCAMAS